MPLLKTPVRSHEASGRIATEYEAEQISVLVERVILHSHPTAEEIVAACQDLNSECITLSEGGSGLPRAVGIVEINPDSKQAEIVHLAALHPRERDRLIDFAENRIAIRLGAETFCCPENLLQEGLADPLVAPTARESRVGNSL